MKLHLLFFLIAMLSTFNIYTQIMTVGLIGPVQPGGWDSDSDMVQNPDSAHLWTLNITLKAGEAKFRANDDWSINWGNYTFPYGVGTQDGNNIRLPSGNYKISFNSKTGVYSFELDSVLSGLNKNIYEIYAIEYDRGDMKPLVSEIAVGTSSKDTLQGNMAIWLLKGDNGRTILVDAGYVTQEPGPAYIRPDSVLQKLHLDPADITDIILTHPHWDHIGGIHLFPNAMIWLQEDDYNYFVGKAWQPNGFSDGFDKNDVSKLVNKNLEGRLTLVKGDSLEILPGIRVFIGSKHTYESQYVLVNGTSGPTIIASDNMWFYANLEYLAPIPHYTFDPEGYVAQMKRMKTLVSDIKLIIPGHDASVFAKFPMVSEGVVKIELKKE